MNLYKTLAKWTKRMLFLDSDEPPKMADISHFQFEHGCCIDIEEFLRDREVLLIVKCEDGLVVIIDQSNKKRKETTNENS